MGQSLCEIIQMYPLLNYVGFKFSLSIKLACDNQITNHITPSLVFYELTEHIDINFHFLHDKIQGKFISTGYVIN